MKKTSPLALLSLLSLALLTFMVPKLMAHGYLVTPESRSYQCRLGANTGCGNVQYEPQSVEGPKGYPGKSVPDGHIASANIKAFFPLDEQTTDRWAKVPIQPGQQDFEWTLTAVHSTTGWQYWITQPDWDPNAPLARESFDPQPFASFSDEGKTPTSPKIHSVNVPERTGYHVILAVWTIQDTPMAFYQVMDVQFSNNDDSEPQAQAATPIQPALDNAPDAYVSGLMPEYTPDSNGDVPLHMNMVSTSDFEVSLTLYDPQGAAIFAAMANLKEDSKHEMYLIKQAQRGNYSVEFKGTGQGDNKGNDVRHTYQFTVNPDAAPKPPPDADYDFVFPDGLKTYEEGTRVLHTKKGRNKKPRVYECKPWPYEGFCQQWIKHSNQYEPGVGQYWKMAWKRVKTEAAQ